MSEKPASKLDYLNPMKIFPALGKAFDKAKETKDTNLLNKISIFFSSFFDEMKGVNKEKEKVKKDTKDAEKKVIDKTIEATKKGAGLKTDVVKEDQDFYNEVLLMATTASNNLEEGHKSDFDSAFEQLDKAVKGEETEPLTFDQSGALAAVGLSLITKLKTEYPKKDDFQKALDRLDKISDNSNFPLKKLLSMPVLAVFGVKIDTTDEGLSAVGSLVGISDKGPAMKFLDKFDMGIGEVLTLKKLKTSPLEDEDEVVDVLKEHIFPNTDKDKVKLVAEKINKIINEKPDHLDTATLADFVFNVDDRDFKRLIVILGGKENA